MPMRSQAQRRYLWAKHPSVARTFEDHTAKGAKLPDRVSAEKKAALAAYLKTAVVAGLTKVSADTQHLSLAPQAQQRFQAMLTARSSGAPILPGQPVNASRAPGGASAWPWADEVVPLTPSRGAGLDMNAAPPMNHDGQPSGILPPEVTSPSNGSGMLNKQALAAYLKTAVVAGPGPSVVPGVPGPTQVQPGTSAPGNAPAPGQGSPSQGGPPAGSTPGASDAQQGMPAPQGPTAPPQGAAGPPGAPPGPPQPQPMNAADAIAMQRIAQMKPGAKPVVKPDLPAQPPGPVALSKSASLILISHVLKKHL